MSCERQVLVGDRYLPCRKATLSDSLSSISSYKTVSTSLSTETGTSYSHLFPDSPRKCLEFTSKTVELEKVNTLMKTHKQLESAAKLKTKEKVVRRLQADKILEVPDVLNNFYLSPLDVSSKGTLVIGLDSKCFFLEKNDQICQFPTFCHGDGFENIYNNSVKFNRNGNLLYLGTTNGWIRVIDLQVAKQVRNYRIHSQRIGCIENTQQWGFLTGSKDKMIVHNDLRVKNPCVLQVIMHQTEVCGISAKNKKIASGSNDGVVNIWDIRNKNTLFSHHQHKGAVKALQWCPWKIDLLASGGGVKDHQIILWNSNTQQIDRKFDGKSQVMGLTWRESSKDLVTVHGGNSVSGGYGLVWNLQSNKYESMLIGHSSRIVGLALDKQQNSLWTLGADKTIRMWRTCKLSSQATIKISHRSSESGVTNFKLK